jgi:opacity protein-like surface antigen
MTKGDVLRKFALFSSVCAVALFAGLAHAQQFDVAVGGSELFSTKNTNASQAYLPPPEKGGIYPSVSIVRTFANHFGYSAELSTVYHQQLYNGFQGYRPIFYDLNAVFVRHVAKRTTADFMGGMGGETVLFYNQYNNCQFAAGCAPRINSTHFLFHAGAGVSYNFWRRLFVRPEANFYYILNNNEFHSDNVLRLGASIGYTFHRD